MVRTLGFPQSIGRNCWRCSALIDAEASKSRQIHKKTWLESNKSLSEVGGNYRNAQAQACLLCGAKDLRK
jgi:hypothetical protein